MPARDLILFRFHEDIRLCKDRIATLRFFNPDTPIYGLYGGPAGEFPNVRRSLGSELESVHLFKHRSRKWKWLHPDLGVKHWFKEFGHTLEFDYLFDYEYDILAAAPLRRLYPKINEQSIALSAVTKLSNVENRWNWTSSAKERPNS